MSIKDKLEKYLGEELEDLTVLDEEMTDDELLNAMVEFIVDLDEDALSDEQVEALGQILDALDVGEDDDEMSEKRLLKKTTAKQRREAKQYRMKNKSKIRAKAKKIKAKRERMAKMGRGLSGKKLGMTKQRS
jgi:hypothetical protein